MNVFAHMGRRLLILAGLAALTSASLAIGAPADLKVVRAVGSPAITVSYAKVKAVRADILINGAFIASQKLDPSKTAGEFGYTLDFDKLQTGDNVVDVTLYDASGKALETQRTILKVERAEDLAVYVRLPKHGSTVQGTAMIQVGFGVRSNEKYVSLYVDGQFRAMKNFPPYQFAWDTLREKNGWHEIQVLCYDETQQTHKSPAIRVFVENPGGRTERVLPEPGAPANPEVGSPTGAAKGLKGTGGALEVTPAATGIAPKGGLALENPKVGSPTGTTAGLKTSPKVAPETSGHRLVTPTDTPKATIQPNVGKTEPGVTGAEPSIKKAIVYGTRLDSEGPYKIYIDGVEVSFDVSPRVENGLPLTPFRHLYEHAGGTVDWLHDEKVCTAAGVGFDVWIKIGDLFAKVNGKSIQLELPAFIDKGRTIVPLSFIRETLAVDVEVDPVTGHVLITPTKEAKSGG